MGIDPTFDAALRAAFPRLGSNYRVLSGPSDKFNCVAWAAGEQHRWWWPFDSGEETPHWPKAAPFEVTLLAFTTVFRLLGYEPSPDGDVVPNVEKIAIYDLNGVPKHVARQHEGRWSSKLGDT